VEKKAPSHLEKEAIMVRSALTVLVLAMLTGFAAAQEPAESASRTHTVVKGGTLWALSQKYYQDPFLWPQIYEANRGQIDDPDLIEPVQQFVIPGISRGAIAGAGGEPAGEPAVVGGVSVSGAGPQAPGMAAEATEPLSERDRRTVFFRDPVTTLGVRGLEEETFLVVSRASVWSAEWLGPANIDRVESDGRVASFLAQGELRTTVPYTRIRLALKDGVRYQVGDAVQMYRSPRTIEGVGSILRPSGVMSITKVDGGVLQLFGRVLLGDFVRPALAFNLQAGQYPDVFSGQTQATVLEFGEVHALYTPGDIAILDRGVEQGVAIGDEYVAFPGDGSSETVVGRLRVVGTEQQTASARIVAVEGPVFYTGIAVHLDRRMR